MMIGQERLRNQINNLTLDTFPKSLLIIGDEGSGKHMLCNEIAEHLNLPLIELDDGVTLVTINEIYISVIPSIYLLDMDKIASSRRNDIQQNKLLKLLEEPPASAFIILLSETKHNIISTILNRCQIWTVDEYSYQEKIAIYGKADEFIREHHKCIAQPGQLINASTNDTEYLDRLTTNIIDNIYRANMANILSIKDKLDFHTNYKYTSDDINIEDKNTLYIDTEKRHRYKYENDSLKEVSELDINIFINCLLNKLSKLLAKNYSNYYFEMFELTRMLANNLKTLNIDKKLLFENYLVNLKLLPYGN